MKKHAIGITYGILLTLFTIYLLLDTFVIVRVYGSAESEDSESAPIETSAESEAPQTERETEAITSQETKEPVTVITENSYKDSNISVTLTDYRKYETDIHVAEIKLSSPEYLRTALAKDSYGKNVTEKTSKTAERKNAIVAVNGDYYGAREKGFVIRNGVLYRSAAAKDRDALVIYEDGSFDIVTESESDANELLRCGAMHVLSFGPALLKDGGIAVDGDDEVKQSMKSNPRTAIGMIEKGHYILLVSDGRTDESAGLSLLELASFMKELGCQTAYNLDGGGSSTMYFLGEIVNNPTTNGSYKERSVSDIVYIGY